MKKYDYLIVGAGLYGAVFAHEAMKHGKSCLVIDKRPNIAGNVYTEEMEGINVHVYGAIFSTPTIVRSGITSISLLNSTALQTVRLQTITASCTAFPLTCIHSIRCGVL